MIEAIKVGSCEENRSLNATKVGSRKRIKSLKATKVGSCKGNKSLNATNVGSREEIKLLKATTVGSCNEIKSLNATKGDLVRCSNHSMPQITLQRC